MPPREAAKLQGLMQPTLLPPAIRLQIHPVDPLSIEAYGYYDGGTNYNNPMAVGDFIGAVALAFGGVSGGTEAQQAIFDVLNSGLGIVGLQGNNDTNVPSAYVNYLFFDTDMVYKRGGFKPIEASADMAQQRIFLEDEIMEEAGYVYAYVSMESARGWV